MFSIEELYGVSRARYCELTGITSDELIRHLEAEVLVLRDNYELVQLEFMDGGFITDPHQRYLSKLLKEIYGKIDRKSAKISDLKKKVGYE